MILQDAKRLAGLWVGRMAPYCERIEIAGSVRREKPEVHDIEIVAVPQIKTFPDLFGQPMDAINLLQRVLEARAMKGDFRFIKSGPRYKQLYLPEGINLDLFLVLPPAQWGVIFTIRTGPAEFSQWCVTQRAKGGGLPSNCRVKGGAVVRGPDGDEEYFPMPEEIDFLDFLGLGWVEPKDRAPKW